MTVTLAELASATRWRGDATPRSAVEIAGAAHAIGHVGRALTHLATAEADRRDPDRRNYYAGLLGADCQALSAIAPHAETRLSLLAAAIADGVARTLSRADSGQRWALTVLLVETCDPLVDLLRDLPPEGGARAQLAFLELNADRLQQIATRHPPGRVASMILDRQLPSPSDARDPTLAVADAIGRLLEQINRTGNRLSAGDCLAVAIAAEAVAREGTDRADTTPRSGSSRLPRDMGAVEGWLAVEATLGQLWGLPGRTGASQDIGAAAHTILNRATAAGGARAVATAAQYLPQFADRISAAVQRWSSSGDVYVPVAAAGGREPAMGPATVTDLAPLTRATRAAWVLSIDAASQCEKMTDLPHLQAANRAAARRAGYADAISDARAVAFAHVYPHALDTRRSAGVTNTQARPGGNLGGQQLPAGYRIIASAAPGPAETYQVRHGTGRGEQRIGTRVSVEEAARLARSQHYRAQASQVASSAKPGPSSTSPGR